MMIVRIGSKEQCSMRDDRIFKDDVYLTQSDNNSLPLGYQKFVALQTVGPAGCYSVLAVLKNQFSPLQSQVQIYHANHGYLTQNNDLAVEAEAVAKK